MRIMARIGRPVLREIDRNNQRVVPCMLVSGAARPGADVPGRATEIIAFSRDAEIWSFTGLRRTLSKKCF
jgi:phosphoenolpyruvate carboxykinase (GTP)